ncbi:MAG: hypothetical protein K5851_03950 [Lachnospiraceae bacterium]|nr:hypothetical protein [Lachnospiraceae bacterium]
MNSFFRTKSKGVIAIMLSLILIVIPVGMLVGDMRVFADSPKASFTIQLSLNENDNSSYAIEWQLMKGSDVVTSSDLPNETKLNGVCNLNKDKLSETVTFDVLTTSDANQYSLRLHSNLNGVRATMDNADITSELNSSTRFFPLTNVNDSNVVSITIEQNNQPSGGPGPNQNPEHDFTHHAKICYTSPSGNWSVHPMVREQYNADGEVGIDEPNSVSYERYAFTAGVCINDGERTDALSQYRYDADISNLNNQVIGYDRENSETTVDITFFTSWANMFEGNININGTDYPVSNYIDFSNRNSCLTHVDGQEIKFTIENVPVSNTIDGENEVYTIDLQVRPIEEDECCVGNFLWSSDPSMDPEVTGVPDDMYIGHSDLTLLSVTYDDGISTKTKTIDELKNDDGSSALPYIQFSKNTDFETGAEVSSMFIPEGSWVTMKIEPEYGYQVKSFNINGESVKTGDESVFSFKIGKGNFHIGAHVEKQEDEARITASNSKVEEAKVELADGTLDRGSARLYLEDADFSSSKQDDFSDFANSTGSTIDSFVNIHMDQVLFKGTGNDDDVWTNEMNDLSNSATVSLKLDGYNGEDVVLLHNIHNGTEFEEIPLKYNSVNKTYEGAIKSFSNFAIAKKNVSANTEVLSPKTSDNRLLFLWSMSILMGTVLMIYGVKEVRKK